LRNKNSGGGFVAGGIALTLLALVALICFIGFLGSLNGTDPGYACIVQEGGPFDGRSVKEVRQGGEGVKSIGIWNHQRCIPATQRNYIISADPQESDSGAVDFVEVPTRDAVNVRVEGQALFQVNTTPDVLKDFYRKYGVRTFSGKHLYDGDKGWESFLRIQIRPIIDNALREAVGSFSCTELNNTCQYVQNATQAVKGKTKVVDNGQNLNRAQIEIEKTLQHDLNSTLGGNYFENIRFRLRGVKFPQGVTDQIAKAQQARTGAATAQLDGQRRVAQAKADTEVSRQQAKQRRLQAEATAKVYKNNPEQAKIDQIKALCGVDEQGNPKGCTNLQVIGGSVTRLLK
jgi:regulator of protease activity HflC (stomatin/prohibitin superfamily)